jgi:hypothetical protein
LMVGWEFFLDDDMDGYTRKLTPALALKLLDQWEGRIPRKTLPKYRKSATPNEKLTGAESSKNLTRSSNRPNDTIKPGL